jgi:nucleotide-binding universal stress UspA family protein
MQRFKAILAVVDRKPSADTVLQRAVALAQTNQAILTAVCVAPRVTLGMGMPDGGPISADLQRAATAAAQEELEKAVAPFRAQVDIRIRVLVGTPFLEIIREVLRHGHDLVIKSPENPDWLDRMLGSDDMHLLRKCPCPVWLVKPAQSAAYRRILAAVDVSLDHPADELATRHQLNIQILEMAASLALADFAELHVAHTWQAIGERMLRGTLLSRPESEVQAYVEQVRQKHKDELDALLQAVVKHQGGDALEFVGPKKHLVKGQARKEIPTLAKRLRTDLVVMGTVARTGVPGFFIGNTAEAILEQIDCSVLAVKPPGFVTPVTLEGDPG